MVSQPTRVSLLAGIFGLVTAFFAFIFAGGSSGKPPSDPPRPPLPSTLPPPPDHPGDASDGPPVPPRDPPAGPPPEPPGNASDEPLERVDMRSVVAIAALYPMILRWLAILRVPRDDRQDAAQDVALLAVRYWHTFRGSETTSETTMRYRWLFRITSNVAAGYWRSPEHRRERVKLRHDIAEPAIAARLMSDAPSPEELLMERDGEAELAMVLFRLRDAMPPERWAVFFAHVVEGHSLHAIAAASGAPFNTVHGKLMDAKRDIRAAIQRLRAQQRFNAARRRKP